MTPSTPELPFPIFQASERVRRYMLYDPNTVTWLRKTHNILGVLIGLAYVVDDQSWHKNDVALENAARRDQIRDSLRREGLEIAKDIGKKRLERTQNALKDLQAKRKAKLTDGQVAGPYPDENSLFNDPLPQENNSSLSRSSSSVFDLHPWAVTPASTTASLSQTSQDTPSSLPDVNLSSYALFRYLHQHGYFMTPGLRFGCQFSVYPGDPLRFHSHFLAISAEWDDDIDLLHLVGGGRLGTGVKKGWMIGGIERRQTDQDENEKKDDSAEVRTFCVEWGGM